jgi:polysaccharide pyruvyl transferase CsaB
MNQKVIISGWYGIPNIGAEAILQQMLPFFRKHFDEIIVFSWDPKYTMKFYHVKSISQFSPIDVIQEIKTSNTFVLGGGDLIDDIGRGLIFWLSKPYISKILRKKVIVSAVSTKPIQSESGKFLVRKILSKFELITLRDEFSYNQFMRLGLRNTYLVSDPTILLKPVLTKNVKKIFKKYDIKKNKKIISICLHTPFQQRRRWSVRKIYDVERLLNALPIAFDDLTGRDFQLLFIPMQISRVGDDRVLAYKIHKKMKHKENFKIIERLYSPGEIKEIIRRTDLLLSMRFHPLIFAFSECVPTIAIACESLLRVKNFHHEMSLDQFTLNLNELTPIELVKKVEDAISFKNEIKTLMRENVKKLKRRAKRNFELIKEYIV